MRQFSCVHILNSSSCLLFPFLLTSCFRFQDTGTRVAWVEVFTNVIRFNRYKDNSHEEKEWLKRITTPKLSSKDKYDDADSSESHGSEGNSPVAAHQPPQQQQGNGSFVLPGLPTISPSFTTRKRVESLTLQQRKMIIKEN